MKKSITSSQFCTYDQYFFYDENAPYIEKENKQAKKWIIAIETETTFTQKFRPALFLKYLDFEHLQINQHSNMYICTKAKYIDVEVNAKWQRRKKIAVYKMFSGPNDCITPSPPPCLLIQALNQSNNIQPWYGEKNPNQQNMYLKPRPTGPMLFDQHLHEIDQLKGDVQP